MIGTHRRNILEFSRCSAKTFSAEMGVAYRRRCSNDSCMCGYKVYGCATKYAGLMSVTEFAQKQHHLVVFLVNMAHRIYNFLPGPTTLPNKNSQM